MKSHHPPDSLLVDRARCGNRRAFELLVLKYRQRIFDVVGRVVRNTEDISDVTQEAFLRAYQAIGKFRGESTFYTWMYRIAINTAMNHFAAQKRRLPHESCSNEESTGRIDSFPHLIHNDNPEHALLREEIQQTLSVTVEQLPKELRMAITLYEVDGMCYEEIAKVMECPVGTIRSRIFRAREALDLSIRPLINGSI